MPPALKTPLPTGSPAVGGACGFSIQAGLAERAHYSGRPHAWQHKEGHLAAFSGHFFGVF